MGTKEDISAGIKQALERGESIQQAKTSFINAGYDSNDVEQAAASISGVSKNQKTKKFKPKPLPKTGAESSGTPKPGEKKMKKQKPKKKKGKRTKLTIFLVILLAILLIGLGVTIFFKDKLMELFSGYFLALI